LDLAALGRVRREMIAPVVEASVKVVKDEIVQAMEDAPPRTGREYLVPGTKTPYTASAPGEQPAIREGAYRDSWKETPAVEAGDTVTARAYTDLRTEDGSHLIGEGLELGTSDIVNYGVRMEPRPHVRPAMENAVPRIRELIEKASGS
jgi:hypothetical protein